jgi:hypothetical protein
METVSNVVLFTLVIGATMTVMVDLRVWADPLALDHRRGLGCVRDGDISFQVFTDCG